MAEREIRGAIRHERAVYVAGMEDALELSAEQAGRLSDLGVIAGDWGGAAPAGYADMDKDELIAEANARELEVQGTGSGGNVLVKDLIAALEADDG